MTEHARETLAAAAAELEVDANYLSSMARRLEKLIIMQKRMSAAFSDDWPDDYSIRIDEVESLLKSSEETFMRYVDLYPELQTQWKNWEYYSHNIGPEIEEYSKTAVAKFREFGDKSRLLTKCAAITKAKLNLPT